MKKKILTVILAVLILLVLFFGACYAWFVYNNYYRLTNVDSELSPSGRYTAVLQMVGTPEWPFGQTTVKITVIETESKKVLKVIDTAIHDDGSSLGEGHWKVTWEDDAVKILLMGSEQKDAVHTVSLE